MLHRRIVLGETITYRFPGFWFVRHLQNAITSLLHRERSIQVPCAVNEIVQTSAESLVPRVPPQSGEMTLKFSVLGKV